jgi:hypothetical protein
MRTTNYYDRKPTPAPTDPVSFPSKRSYTRADDLCSIQFHESPRYMVIEPITVEDSQAGHWVTVTVQVRHQQTGSLRTATLKIAWRHLATVRDQLSALLGDDRI